MKKWSGFMAGAALALASGVLSGCDWNTGGGVDDFNERYNFINFSGVYRGSNGGPLITDYSASRSTTQTADGTAVVNGELVGVGNDENLAFFHDCEHSGIVPGSITVSASPSYVLIDSNGDGTLESSDENVSGSINYGSGKLTVNFNDALDNGNEIVASYTYNVAQDDNTVSDSDISGASGGVIYSLTVEHYGNQLNIVDNNGARYEGKFGDIRADSGANQDGGTVVAGQTFVGSFEANGTSAAGYYVKIVGTLQGVIGSASSGGFVLDGRQMFGTWIEEDGRSGDVSGYASPISINVSSTTSTNS